MSNFDNGSDRKGKGSPLGASGRARRQFLQSTALAAGASAAAILPRPVGAAESQGAQPTSTLRSCPDVKMPMKDVEGKVAVITGGSSGIGLGIARAFVEAGMKVVLTYRTQAHIDEAMTHFKTVQDRVHPIRVDVTDRPGMENAAEEAIKVFGKVHALVNNAGVYVAAPLSRSTYDDWDWVVGVNLTGVFNGVHTFLPLIQAHGEGGHIITTSSALGLFVVKGMGSYCPTKFAVVGMMEALRAELADTNIGVSVYCPGLVSGSAADASRNRPSSLGETHFKPDPKAVQEAIKWQRNPEVAMDPLEAGRRVLQGIRHNDLYILTHPEIADAIRVRSEALNASNATELTVRAVLPADPIYATERDRRHCAQTTRSKTK